MEILIGLKDGEELKGINIHDELYLSHLKRGFHSDF